MAKEKKILYLKGPHKRTIRSLISNRESSLYDIRRFCTDEFIKKRGEKKDQVLVVLFGINGNVVIDTEKIIEMLIDTYSPISCSICEVFAEFV